MPTTKRAIELAPAVLEDQGEVVERVVSMRAPDPARAYECPECKCKTVLVEGAFRRIFTEEIHDGKSQGYELDNTIEKNILAVHCPSCQARFVYEPEEVYELRDAVVDLNLQLAGANGFQLTNKQVN